MDYEKLTTVREQLYPGETLLCCEPKRRWGLVLLAVGVFFLYIAGSMLFDFRGDFAPEVLEKDWVTFVFFIAIGLLMMYPAFSNYLFAYRKYYFVTDRRLCISTLKGLREIPAAAIRTALIEERRHSVRSGNKRRTHIYFIVYLKDGERLVLNPQNRDNLLKALQSIITE